METNIEKITKAIHRVEAAAHRKKAQLTKKSLKWLHARKAEIEKEISHLMSLLGAGPTKKPTKGKAKRKGKRIRRDPAQLKADAAKIIAHLKAHPGSLIKDIDKLGVNYGLSVKDFVKKHGGVTLKGKGPRNKMAYSVG